MKTATRDLERMIIGSMVNLSDMSGKQAQKAFGMIKVNMFSDPNNRLIFDYITRLVKSNKHLDTMEINSLLENDNSYQEGFTYFPEIVRNNRTTANLIEYCRDLRKRAQKRFALSKLSDALIELQDDHNDRTDEIMAGLGSFVDEFISKQSDEKGLVHISDIMPKFIKQSMERFENPESFRGMTTGIEQLDNLLYPKMVRKGTLMVVGARPKMGKTMLLNKIANHSAIGLNKATIIFSMEMLQDEVVERAIADESKIGTEIFYSGAKSEHEWGVIGEVTSRLKSSNLYINDQAGLTLAQIKSQSRSVAKRHSVGFICIDYLTLMEGEKAERNDLSYGIITKGLKALAKELECCVLLLTQLNRGLENRANKRPMPSDSRDTGQIEQDADYWLGLYRESVYNKDISDDYKGFTELELRLNRHGNTGTCYLNMSKGSFNEIDVNEYAKMDHQIKQNESQKGGYDG
jgi:replicative DNA helicase